LDWILTKISLLLKKYFLQLLMNSTNSTANPGAQKETDIDKTATGQNRHEVSQANISWVNEHKSQPMTLQEAFEYAKQQKK